MTQPTNRGLVDGLAIPRFGGPATYVSWDIDVLDPAFAPGTGTPETGGLTNRELLNMLRSFGELNLVGADMGEVAPAHDHAELIGIAAAHAGGAMFIVVSYAGHLAFPDWQHFTNVDSAALDVMKRIGGSFLASFFTAAYIAGCFASAMALQASVSRILYAMGRDGVLPPRFFGRLSERLRTPVQAILLVGVVSGVALFISLNLAAAMISFGALAAFSFVNLAVIKHFVVDEGRHRTSLSKTTFMAGGIWVAVGLLWLVFRTRMFTRRPPELRLSDDELESDELSPSLVGA